MPHIIPSVGSVKETLHFIDENCSTYSSFEVFSMTKNSNIDLETFEETPVFLKSQQKTNMTAAKNGVTDKNECAK